MKKVWFTLVLLFIVFSLFAKEISREMAVDIAKEQLFERNSYFTGQIASVDSVSVDGVKCYYVVRFIPMGWALIAANDVVAPLLGYSFDTDFYKDNQPESVKEWLNHYNEQLMDASKNDSRSYNSGRSFHVVNAVKVDKIDPLVKVNWNQSKPYNLYCPSDANGQAVVGCVAVAMAQAMSVVKYPTRPQGNFSYFCNPYGVLSIDYDKESAYDWNVILSGSDAKVSVARLLYQCGVALRMNYSSTGSGTQTSYVPNALKTYFAYPSSVTAYSRDSYQQNWEELILNELKAGRPVIYSGYDGVSASGHCFNLDGYDGNNMYHVNWGWGGQNNGYYTINALKDGDQDYTKQQMVVVGVRAPSVGPTDIKLTNYSIRGNLPVGSVVGEVKVESEAVNPVYSFDLKGMYSIYTHAYLPSSFYIENNLLKTKEVFDYENGDVSVIIKATNIANGMFFEREFIVNVTENASAVDLVKSDEFKIDVLGRVLSVYNNKPVDFAVYSMSGVLLKSGKLNNINGVVSLKDLSAGSYLIKVSSLDGVKTKKIILR